MLTQTYQSHEAPAREGLWSQQNKRTIEHINIGNRGASPYRYTVGSNTSNAKLDFQKSECANVLTATISKGEPDDVLMVLEIPDGLNYSLYSTLLRIASAQIAERIVQQ